MLIPDLREEDMRQISYSGISLFLFVLYTVVIIDNIYDILHKEGSLMRVERYADLWV